MILLVTPIEKRAELAVELKEAMSEEVLVANTLLEATTTLRTQAFNAVVFDKNLIEAEPHEIDNAYAHLGTAIPISVNLALTGISRLVREIRCALHRRSVELSQADKAATEALRADLNEAMTELSLQCELAAATDERSAIRKRIAPIQNAVKRISARLETSNDSLPKIL